MLGMIAVGLAAAGCQANARQAKAESAAAEPEASAAAPVAPEAKKEEEHGSNWNKAEPGVDAAPPPKGWREPMVYVDGVPLGALIYDELPHTLKPVWIDDVELLDFKPGDKGPRERKIKYRRYRLADYLAAVGVDVKRVTAVHLHGGGGWVAGISGETFRQFRDDMMFDFSREGTGGHVRPYFPDDMKLNTKFDRLAGVTIYIDKVPPLVNEFDVAEMDGKRVDGIAYFGQPLRGGVRIYLNGRLAAVVKRNTLADKSAPVGADGRRGLFEFLTEQGVDVSLVAVADLIHRGKRVARVPRVDLLGLRFGASEKAKGEILVGADGTPVNVIMLYSKGKAPAATTAQR